MRKQTFKDKFFHKLRSMDKEYLIIAGIGVFVLVVGIFGTMHLQKNAHPKEDAKTQIQKVAKEKDDDEIAKENDLDSDKEEDKIYVHVDGQVAKPGVYTLKKQARLQDLITLCGGTLPEANTKSINLATKLEDGQKIYIPANDELPSDSAPLFNSAFSTYSLGENIRVNINTNSTQELEKIPQIGTQTANKIIQWRKENGDFKQKEDIMKVPGIGQNKFDKIKEHIYTN